jgi:Mrp family chromosome partitioning ATPase
MSGEYKLLTALETGVSETEAGEKESGHLHGASRAGSRSTPPLIDQSFLDVDDPMRQLVRTVFLTADETAPRTVMFCGVDAKNASSGICAQVGRALAASDHGRVCMVDANLRSPQLSSMFDAALRPKVVTAAPSPITEQCAQIETGLWLAGPGLVSRRGTLPSAEELKQLLKRLRAVFDYLLVDVPGISRNGEAAFVGSVVDAAILVIEANSTRRLSAKNAQKTLAGAGVRILGTVLNNRSFPIPEKLYKII